MDGEFVKRFTHTYSYSIGIAVQGVRIKNILPFYNVGLFAYKKLGL